MRTLRSRYRDLSPVKLDWRGNSTAFASLEVGVDGIALLSCRSPEIATVKQKMLYTSSKQALRNKLRGLHAEIQCTDDSELCMSYVLEKCSRKYN